MKVILTGASGYVGEGILLECLSSSEIEKVLVIGRRTCGRVHPKLSELIVPNFNQINNETKKLADFDACFYCAGISSAGLSEEAYTAITYDVTLLFANTFFEANPTASFHLITGRSTDSTETGKVMWARIKGKTENALLKMEKYNSFIYRPGYMQKIKGQKNSKLLYTVFGWFYSTIYPSQSLSFKEIFNAMIKASKGNEHHKIFEIEEIK